MRGVYSITEVFHPDCEEIVPEFRIIIPDLVIIMPVPVKIMPVSPIIMSVSAIIIPYSIYSQINQLSPASGQHKTRSQSPARYRLALLHPI